MEWQFIIALVIAVPIILLPAVFIWYLNISGLIQAWKARNTEIAKAAKVKVMRRKVVGLQKLTETPVR